MKDISGADAAEKLTVLIRHFARFSLRLQDIEATGIEALEPADLQCAAGFGGTIKPVACADWSTGRLSAWVGPAFLAADHPLARLHGGTNGIALSGPGRAPLLFSGPGAGPEVTAATILDDVLELMQEGRPSESTCERERDCDPPDATGWFVRIHASSALPGPVEIADLLSAYGVWPRCSSGGDRAGLLSLWLLTYPASARQITGALCAVRRACGAATRVLRTLESHDE